MCKDVECTPIYKIYTIVVYKGKKTISDTPYIIQTKKSISVGDEIKFLNHDFATTIGKIEPYRHYKDNHFNYVSIEYIKNKNK